MSTYKISVRHLARRFWRQTTFTWTLVLVEGAILVAMPLVIGWAIDGLLNDSRTALFQLAGLCLLLLIVGAGRRLHDTRAYASIYSTVAGELVAHEQRRETSLSKISARSNLFSELISFLEDSIPGVIHEFINLGGTLLIIGLIDWRVFLVCLAGMVFTALVYGVSRLRILRFHTGLNDEFERQIDVLGTGDKEEIQHHFKHLMSWRIKLSDLDTFNFSVIWLALSGLLLLTITIVTSSGEASFGEIVSTVMYVFGFIGSVLVLPVYYQQLIRLREITTRLTNPEASDPNPSSGAGAG